MIGTTSYRARAFHDPRSHRHLGHPASAACHRRGDGRGDAAHRILADPQFQPRLLMRDLRSRWPPDRSGRACAHHERQARAVIATWRDGVYSAEAVLDDDGRGRDDIVIRATVEKRGSDLTVDLSASDPEVTSFVNSSYANMRAGVAAALAYLIDSDTPKNDGAFRPLKVIAKPGTVVWANAGAPVTLCTSHCGNEIIEAVIKALAPACPDRAMAGWGRRFRIAIQGRDPRTDRGFIWHMFQARPGGC